MDWIQALILGLIQGLTEYLPVSSSGHLAIGSYLFGIEGEENLAFTVAVHVATVLSTFVILWSEIDWIFRGLFKFKLNDETKYFLNIVVSMIPIGIVGVFFKDYVEEGFGSGLLIVGCMLLLTAALLAFSYYAKQIRPYRQVPATAHGQVFGEALNEPQNQCLYPIHCRCLFFVVVAVFFLENDGKNHQCEACQSHHRSHHGASGIEHILVPRAAGVGTAGHQIES